MSGEVCEAQTSFLLPDLDLMCVCVWVWVLSLQLSVRRETPPNPQLSELLTRQEVMSPH